VCTWCRGVQDQLRAMRQLMEAAFGEDRPFVDVYDGDTPKVRQPPTQPNVILCVVYLMYEHLSVSPKLASAATHILTRLAAGRDMGSGGVADVRSPRITFAKLLSHEYPP
jgi:hypothetical protein